MTTQTECRWGRALCPAEDVNNTLVYGIESTVCYEHEPPRVIDEVGELHHADGTPCGGAECEDRREGCEDLTTLSDGTRVYRVITRRREESTGGKDRRQPRCGNPECGAPIRWYVGGSETKGGLWLHETPPFNRPGHGGIDYEAADPPGRDEGRCQRGRKKIEAPGARLVERLREAAAFGAYDSEIVNATDMELLLGEAATEIERLWTELAVEKLAIHILEKQANSEIERLQGEAARYREALERMKSPPSKEAFTDPEVLEAVNWVRRFYNDIASEALNQEPDHD